MFVLKQCTSSGRITSSVRGRYRVVTIVLSFRFSGIASTALCDSDLESQDPYSNGPGFFFFRRAGNLGYVVNKTPLRFSSEQTTSCLLLSLVLSVLPVHLLVVLAVDIAHIMCLSHKRHVFLKKLFIIKCVLISTTTFV